MAAAVKVAKELKEGQRCVGTAQPFTDDMIYGSSTLKQMVFGIITAIDLLNYVASRERRERTLSECSLPDEL
ncbi:hypothetical protein AOLI_G00089710 [Acnodon oligacanthus]